MIPATLGALSLVLLAVAGIMAATGAAETARRLAVGGLVVFCIAGAVAIVAARRFHDCVERGGISYRFGSYSPKYGYESCPKSVLGLRDPF